MYYVLFVKSGIGTKLCSASSLWKYMRDIMYGSNAKYKKVNVLKKCTEI